tara:strand:+ start:7104 stop:8102 length:999 start_codon:yes stop_codon:yes gene_type:complete
MKIGKHDLNKKIMIVAEIGNNHEGSLRLAKKMIKLAASSGADAVKFQTFVTEDYVSRPFDINRFNMLKKFQLSFKEFIILKNYAEKFGLIFLSTPFDIKSAIFLNKIIKAYKVASSDISFYPLLEVISKTNKPIILSAGIADINDIKKTLNFIKKYRSLKNVILLHCVSNYPTSHKDSNINNIQHLRNIVNHVGYSDHTEGIEAALCASAIGARVIEKHFTINKNFSDFKDHKISSDPEEFSNLVKNVRKFETIMGKNSFKTSIMKKKSMKIKRSIAVNKDLPAGTILKFNHLTWVRPGIGFPPGSEKKILGKKIKKKIIKGTILKKTILTK